jgi:hypothetical protein
MVAEDFDQDGDYDLAGAGYAGDLVVLENPGNLLTTPGERYDYESPDHGKFGTREIQTADVNQDGDPDLLIGSGNGLMIYQGRPGMEFQLSERSVGRTEYPVSGMTVADFDGDGTKELAVSCRLLSCITILAQKDGKFVPTLIVDVPSGAFLTSGDFDGDGKADLAGTGDVLWTALSSRRAELGRPEQEAGKRTSEPGIYINELLAKNSGIRIEEDGGKKSDWVELYSSHPGESSLRGYRLRYERPVVEEGEQPREFRFPANARLGKDGHLLVFFSSDQRSPYHTGFRLPGEGGTLCLIDAAGNEVDRVIFPEQLENRSYGRYQDGTRSFAFDEIPTPGTSNQDNGTIDPAIKFQEFDIVELVPNHPIRFNASGKDELGIVGMRVLYRELKIGNEPAEIRQVILYDDGMHEDRERLDGFFSGVLESGLPPGADVQFYIEAMDLSGNAVRYPEDAEFTNPGEFSPAFSLSFAAGPPLVIGEVVADNATGRQDEVGGTPDYVTVLNPTGQAVSLDGIALGQKIVSSRKNQFLFPNGLTLEAGESIAVFLDENRNQGPLHAPFRIEQKGEQLLLFGTSSAGARTILDRVHTGELGKDEAFYRVAGTALYRKGSPGDGQAALIEPWTGPAYDAGGNEVLAYIFPTEAEVSYVAEFRAAGDDWQVLGELPGDGSQKSVSQPAGTQGEFRLQQILPLASPAGIGEVLVRVIARNAVEIHGAIDETGGDVPEVVLYYGPEDGGDDAEAWAQSENLGAQSGEFAITLKGLSSGQEYAFRLVARNRGGEAWSENGSSFTTLSDHYPKVSNGAVSEIQIGSARIGGQLASGGIDESEVLVVWGDEDGGTVAASWDHQQSAALDGNGGFSVIAGGLEVEQTYYYRTFATNSAGTAWADETASFRAPTYFELLERNFMMTELMYHPSGRGTRQEDDLEYIEFENVGDVPLELGGIRIGAAFVFDFSEGDISVIEPGQHVLVVRSRAAFESVYGERLPVAGEWLTPFRGGKLSDKGEQIIVSYEGSVIHNFRYDDRDPWPREADGRGFSLVLRNPDAGPDHSDPGEWTISREEGGSPGIQEALVAFSAYDRWQRWYAIEGSRNDPDGDGLTNELEYLFATNPNHSDAELATAQVGFVDDGGVDYLGMGYRFQRLARDVHYFVEASIDLSHWVRVDSSVVEDFDHGDGSGSRVVRLTTPFDSEAYPNLYIRVRGIVSANDPVAVPPPPSDGKALPVLLDWDGDGDSDYFTGRWYRSEGGFFSEFSGAWAGFETIQTADIDGNGSLDFVGGQGTGVTVIRDLESQLIPTDEALPQVWQLSGGKDGSIDLGDSDGDGDLDLLVTGLRSGSRSETIIYRNDGDSGFLDSANSLFPGVLNSLDPADFDGDGDLDLFSNTGNSLVAYRNDGAGQYAAVELGLAPIGELRSFDWGDFDGDPDLLVSNGVQIRIYENRGGGNFATFTPEISEVSPRANSVSWGDFNPQISYGGVGTNITANFCGRFIDSPPLFPL